MYEIENTQSFASLLTFRGRTQLLTDCWNNYRDVYALPLNSVVLGDVLNYRPTKNCMCALGLRQRVLSLLHKRIVFVYGGEVLGY
jgi:hypothetical protein